MTEKNSCCCVLVCDAGKGRRMVRCDSEEGKKLLETYKDCCDDSSDCCESDDSRSGSTSGCCS